MIAIATMIEGVIDRSLSAYVTTTSSALTVFLVPIAITGYTLTLVMHALAIIRGDSQDPLSKILKDFLAAAIISAIALSMGNYQSIVIEGAQALQGDFTAALSTGVDSGTAPRSLGASIDLIFSPDNKIRLPEGKTIDGKSEVPIDTFFYVLAHDRANFMGIPDLSLALAGVLLTVAELFIIACCLLAWLPAKVALAFWLAMGPAGILCLMFPVTKNYFQQWLSATLGTIFTMAIVTAIVAIIPVMYRQLLLDILTNMDIASTDVIGRVAAILIASVGLGIVAVNAAQKGAHLAGGGIALDGRGLAAFVINTMMQRGRGQGNGQGVGTGDAKGKGSGGAATEGKGSGQSDEESPEQQERKRKGLAYGSGRAVRNIRNILNGLNRRGDK